MVERKLVEALHAAGISSVVSSFWQEDEDGCVKVLGTSFHVQVGDGYLVVNEQVRPDAWLDHGHFANVPLVVKFLGSLLKQTR